MMGRPPCSRFLTRYRSTGPDEVWTDTSQSSSNSSTPIAREALLAMLQEQPPQCTAASKTEVFAPVTPKGQASTRSTPTSEWVFRSPFTALSPIQLINRNTLQPIRFGEFLRGYLADLQVEARQAKIDAGITLEAIMDEATQQARDFERNGRLVESPGFKEVLDAARVSYEVKRKAAEDEWYEAQQRTRSG
jgi:hypothetical protein